MDIIVIVFLALTIFMVFMIGTLLYQLSKSGDERKKFIKTKTMANTFLIMVGVLLIDVIASIINGGTATNNPIIFLFVIASVFLISLFVNKRKYGG